MDDLEIVYVLRRRINRLEQKLKSLTCENVQNNIDRNKQTVARICRIEARLIKLRGIHHDTVHQVYSRLHKRVQSAPVTPEEQMKISQLDIGDTITTLKMTPVWFKLDDQKNALKDIIYPTDGTDRDLINTIARYRTIINKSKDFRDEPLEVNEHSIETVIIGLDTFARQYGGELSFTKGDLSFSHPAKSTACGIVNLGSIHLLAMDFIPTAKFSIKLNLNYDRDLARSSATMKNFILQLHQEFVHVLRCKSEVIRIFSIEKLDHRRGMIQIHFGLTTPDKNQTESLARHFQTLVRRSDFRNEQILRSIESTFYRYELTPTLSYLQLNSNDFNPSRNSHYASTNQSSDEQCGNQPYHPPIRWFYHAIHLSDKYSDDHTWCARVNIDGEWAIAFHGTTSRTITDDQSTDRSETTEAKSGLFVTTHCNGGADAYTTPFTISNGDQHQTFRMAFQCRVKPNSFTAHNNALEVGQLWQITDPRAINEQTTSKSSVDTCSISILANIKREKMSHPISVQPGVTYHFQNTFAPLSGENIVRLYECQEGCCNCGPKSSLAVTDSRVIIREKEPDTCCGCIEGPHVDTTIFLHDIELLRETSRRTARNPCIAVLTSGNILALCCICCRSCCGDRPKWLEARGGFNTEYLPFKIPDVPAAANDITAMLVAAKNKNDQH